MRGRHWGWSRSNIMNNLGNKNSKAVPGSSHTDLIQSTIYRSDVATPPNDLSEVLLRAAMIGDSVSLNVLLDRGADVNCRDDQGRSALIEASFGGHCDVVKLLIARGADLNASDKDGWTAL